MREEWAVSLLQQCRAAGAAFFFKQWGGVNKKRAGRILLGRTFEEQPDMSSPDLFSLTRDAAG